MKRLPPEIEKNVLDNLRRNNPELKDIPNERLISAWDNWNISEDYPDETKIILWVDL